MKKQSEERVPETRWTPGPWTAEDPLGPDTLSIVQANKEPYEWAGIALVPADDVNDAPPRIDATQQIANAHLIAAAPELYEALERAIDLVERGHRCIERQEWEPGETAQEYYHATGGNCIASLRAALARARGEHS